MKFYMYGLEKEEKAGCFAIFMYVLEKEEKAGFFAIIV